MSASLAAAVLAALLLGGPHNGAEAASCADLGPSLPDTVLVWMDAASGTAGGSAVVTLTIDPGEPVTGSTGSTGSLAFRGWVRFDPSVLLLEDVAPARSGPGMEVAWEETAAGAVEIRVEDTEGLVADGSARGLVEISFGLVGSSGTRSPVEVEVTELLLGGRSALDRVRVRPGAVTLR